MAFGDAFINFLHNNNIPAEEVTVGDGIPFIFLNYIVVSELVKQSYALPVSNGGLIIGKFHNEGGVHIITPYRNGFKYIAEVEGYEYIVNPMSTSSNREFLKNINESVNHNKNSKPYKFYIPKHIQTINLEKLRFDIMIIPNGEWYVINRTATEKYLNEIDEINDRRFFKKILRFFGL